MAQTSEIHERVLGKGIDARNAENQLNPGYWESLINADSDGDIVKKRRGYQQLGGYLPFRVNSVEWTYDGGGPSGELCFNLADYVDLARSVSSPIVVRGSNNSGTNFHDFSTNPSSPDEQYYSGFTVPIRNTGGTPVTIDAGKHGHSSWLMHAEVIESLSNSDLSSSLFIEDTLDVNFTDATDPNTLTSSVIDTTQAVSFIHISAAANTLGSNNYYPNAGGVPVFSTSPGGDFSFPTLDISNTTLNSTNLIVSVYQKDGLSVEKVRPDDILITGTDLDISLSNTPVGAEYIYVVSTVDNEDVTAGQVTAAVQQVVIPSNNPFTIFNIYTLDGNTREFVIPDSIVYDDEDKEFVLTFQTSDAINYQIYALEAGLLVNQLCVTPNSLETTSGETSLVELDLYGLDPLEVMTVENRNHWATHIDTYRSTDLTQLLAGVAGVEYTLSSTNLVNLQPRYQQILENSVYIGPLFNPTGTAIVGGGIGRGLVLFDGNDNEITDVAYQTGSGFVRFTISAPNLDASLSGFTDNLDGTFTSSLDNDLLNVQKCGYSIINGSHMIQSMILDTNTDQIFVDCSVTGVTNSDFDETDVGGFAQVNTTTLELSSTPDSTNTFFTGVRIRVGTTDYTVRGNDFSTTEKIYLESAPILEELSAGLFIFGINTGPVVPVKDDVSGWVAGDTFRYTGIDRWVRVKRITEFATSTVTIAGDLVTVPTSGQANTLVEGQKVIIQGIDGGVFTIQDIVDGETFQIDRTSMSTTGRLIGQTFEIDEDLQVADTVDDSQLIQPTFRWLAVQKPNVPSTVTQFQNVQDQFAVFTADQQAIIRSTMAADNMYLTNGEDPVLKYDGLSLTRAGLFRWEGGTFVRIEDGATGAIPYLAVTVAGNATGKTFVASTAGEALTFTAGQVVITNTGIQTTVRSIDASTNTVVVEDDIDSETSLTESSTLKYYFRLNIIDANNNIIGSAVTGSNNDYVVTMTDDTTVGIKLAIPPQLPLLDYDRLEYEIFRTKQDGSVFFRVATIPITYDGTGYVYFEDTVADSELFEDDPVSTSTFGAELATATEEPLVAKYVTSANNRLVLGNLKDKNRVNIEILRPSTELTSGQLNTLNFAFTTGNATLQYRFNSATSSLAGETVNTSGVFGSSLFTAGTWYYIGTTKTTDFTPEGYGWFKAVSDTTLNLLPAASISYGAGDFLVTGSPNTVPIFTGDETTDGDAGYQSGGNQIKIQTKLINAINATQYEAGNLALAGEGRTDASELGKFSIKSLTNEVFSLTITHSASPSLFDRSTVLVNNTKVSSAEITLSVTQSYGSRLLVSFQNFPEVFDRPRAVIPADSQSVIDVNSADGQEITGIIPFFGESTSQDSRKQDIVICFKENSIYAVNVTTRTITKIDSRGVGCNAPNSIAAVPNGIVFAAKSGVYRLNRSFDVIWVGRYLDRVWNENTNLDQLDLATGHVYPQEKQYRLSVPVNQDERATEVYTYEYGDEQAGQVGAWTRYTNIPSTGWASDGTESYFGSSTGRVYTIRNTGTDSDFRDDDAGILWDCTYRGLDFGAPGIRKLLRAIVSHFRVLKQDSGTTLEVATDLTDSFTGTTAFTLTVPVDDGLSTLVNTKVKTIRQSIPNQKGVFYQVRYKNESIDTPVALAGITFHVAGLKYTGITQAVDT